MCRPGYVLVCTVRPVRAHLLRITVRISAVTYMYVPACCIFCVCWCACRAAGKCIRYLVLCLQGCRYSRSILVTNRTKDQPSRKRHGITSSTSHAHTHTHHQTVYTHDQYRTSASRVVLGCLRPCNV